MHVNQNYRIEKLAKDNLADTIQKQKHRQQFVLLQMDLFERRRITHVTWAETDERAILSQKDKQSSE
jgi:hypothetical protein